MTLPQRLAKSCTRGLVFLLSFAIVEVSFSLHASAATMIPTSQVLAEVSRGQNLEKVEKFLGRAEVQNELTKRGVSPQEASQRIAALSDFELQKLAGNIDVAPAGAEPVLVIGLTTLLLVIIIILLLR